MHSISHSREHILTNVQAHGNIVSKAGIFPSFHGLNMPLLQVWAVSRMGSGSHRKSLVVVVAAAAEAEGVMVVVIQVLHKFVMIYACMHVT